MLERVAKHLKMRSLDDWYSIDLSQLATDSNSTLHRMLSRYYSNSLVRALHSLYPDYPWKPWKFRSVPAGYWEEDFLHHRSFFEDYFKSHYMREYEDWYKVRQVDIIRYGGGVLHYFGGSLSRALSTVYPEYDWKEWKFAVASSSISHSSKDIWRDSRNVTLFLREVEQELNITSWEDWYRVTPQELLDRGGYGLITLYGGSVMNLVKSIYPNHPWKDDKFVLQMEWKKNPKEYLDYLGKQVINKISGFDSQPPHLIFLI